MMLCIDIRFSVKASLEYIWKKLRKLYPLYFVVTLYSVSFSELPKLIADSEFDGPFKYLVGLLIRNLLLIHTWVRGEYFAFSEVGWFLAAIMFLYLLDVPLRACATRIRQRAESTGRTGAVSYTFAGISVITVLLILIYCFLLRNTYVEFTEYVLPAARIGEYVLGMSVGYALYPVLNTSGTKQQSGNRALYTVIEFLSIILWVAFLFLPVTSWESKIVRWLLPNVLLILTFAVGRGYLSRLFVLPPLKFLGNISFGIYLIHSMVIRSITLFNLSGSTLETKLGKVTTGFLCILVTILLSALTVPRKYRKGTS